MLQRVVHGSDGKLHFGPEDETNYFVAGTALRRYQGKLFSEYSWTTDHPMHDLEHRYTDDTDVHFDELNKLAEFKGDPKRISWHLFDTDPEVLKLKAKSYSEPTDPKEGPRTRLAMPVACSPVKATETITIEEKQFERFKQHEINMVKKEYIDWSKGVSKFIKKVAEVTQRKAPKESPVVGRAAYNIQVQKVQDLQQKLKNMKSTSLDEAAVKKAEDQAMDATAGEAAWKDKYMKLYKEKQELATEIQGLKDIQVASDKALSQAQKDVDHSREALKTQAQHNQSKLELEHAKGHQLGFQKGLDHHRGSQSSSRSPSDNPLNSSFEFHHQLGLMPSQGGTI